MRMVPLLEISTPCKVQAEWPRMDVIVLTLVKSIVRLIATLCETGPWRYWKVHGTVEDMVNKLFCSKIHNIKMNHIWTLIAIVLLMKHIWTKIKGCLLALVKKEKNTVKLQKVIYKKHKNCSRRTSTKDRLFRTFNGHSLAFAHAELYAREASSFCDFWQMTSCDFTAFYFFFY